MRRGGDGQGVCRVCRVYAGCAGCMQGVQGICKVCRVYAGCARYLVVGDIAPGDHFIELTGGQRSIVSQRESFLNREIPRECAHLVSTASVPPILLRSFALAEAMRFNSAFSSLSVQDRGR
jgi:hypothetical protein